MEALHRHPIDVGSCGMGRVARVGRRTVKGSATSAEKHRRPYQPRRPPGEKSAPCTGRGLPAPRNAAPCTGRGLAAPANAALCTVLSGCASRNEALCTRPAAAGRPRPARRGTLGGISRHGAVHPTSFLGMERYIGRDSPAGRGTRGTGGLISRRASQKAVQPAAFLGTRPRAAGTPRNKGAMSYRSSHCYPQTSVTTRREGPGATEDTCCYPEQEAMTEAGSIA